MTYILTCAEKEAPMKCDLPGCELEDWHTHYATPEWGALSAATGAMPTGTQEGYIALLEARIAKLEAVRDAARRTIDWLWGYKCCDDERGRHGDDCPVPALRAALDAARAPS